MARGSLHGPDEVATGEGQGEKKEWMRLVMRKAAAKHALLSIFGSTEGGFSRGRRSGRTYPKDGVRRDMKRTESSSTISTLSAEPELEYSAVPYMA